MDVTFGNRAVALHELKKTFKDGGVVLDDGSDHGGRLLAGLVRNQISVDAALDERLSHATVDIVDPFNLSRFNRPFAGEAGAEFGEGAALLQIGALIVPELE